MKMGYFDGARMLFEQMVLSGDDTWESSVWKRGLPNTSTTGGLESLGASVKAIPAVLDGDGKPDCGCGQRRLSQVGPIPFLDGLQLALVTCYDSSVFVSYFFCCVASCVTFARIDLMAYTVRCMWCPSSECNSQARQEVA